MANGSSIRPKGGKRHPDYPRVWVYENGSVWSDRSKRMLETTIVRLYPYVYIYNKQGIRKGVLLNRLVAQVWVKNPKKKREVGHNDGVKTNCAAKNLSWETRSENMKHAWRTGLRK